MARRRTKNAGLPLENTSGRRGFFWGLSPRRLVIVGLVLTVLAASLGASWLLQGIRGLKDLNGPHQQWHGVVVEHHRGDLLFTTIGLQYSLVVGFIDRHNPAATFTVNVDADTYAAISDGILITLDLGPQTGHVYALSTSHDGVTWSRQPLDPGGDQLRLVSWLLVPFGGVLGLLGLLGLVLACIGLIDFLGGTETISGMVVEVVEGSLFRQPRVIVDRGGQRELLALRSSMYEKICDDGGRSQMSFVVSRRLRHVRRVRRKRAGGVITVDPEGQPEQQGGEDWQAPEELPAQGIYRHGGSGQYEERRRLQSLALSDENWRGQEERQEDWQEEERPPHVAERRGRSGVEWSEDGTWVVQQGGGEQETWRDASSPRWQAEPPQQPLHWEQQAPRRSVQSGPEERSVEEWWQQWRDQVEPGEERPAKRWRKKGS